MNGRIVVSDRDAVRTIAIRHPGRTDALGGDLWLAISEAIESAQRNPAIRCLIVSGQSGAFAAGGNNAEEPEAVRSPGATRLLRALVGNRKPIVAAVDGAAEGIGTMIVFHCDYVVAGTTATFGSPLPPHDPVPDGAISLLAPRLLGHQRAFAMLVLRRPISAQDAHEARLVDAIVPPGQVMVEAERIARDICKRRADDIPAVLTRLKPPMEAMLQRMAEEDRCARQLSSAVAASPSGSRRTWRDRRSPSGSDG